MQRIHAFGDDALSDLDAVGLAAELRARRVSVPELIRAAIARTEAVNPALNGLAYEAFDRALARAEAGPVPGFFGGIPTYVKDNAAVAGMPTMEGTDAWDPRPQPAHGDFARLYLGTGVIPLGKTQMSEFGFSASAEHPRLGPVRNPWHPEHTAGASSSGSGAFVAAGVVPIAHANDGGGSIRIPAAFYREAELLTGRTRLPPIGDITRPGAERLRIAVCTRSINRDASPEVRELTLKTAALLEELGHHVTPIDNPVPRQFQDDFLLYWAFLAMAVVRSGRRTFGPGFDRDRLDNLTLGLDSHAARNLHRLPAAMVRLSRLRRVT